MQRVAAGEVTPELACETRLSGQSLDLGHWRRFRGGQDREKVNARGETGRREQPVGDY
jgi:hypothetical protein